ncbi:hypothetical protein LEUCIP111803_01289 [Leucobacter soli]|uniref:HTH cro/C1-type domain-containing protein n=2 Tax=Leucobacter soli TaxID=2812850 RepID=A0A916JY75_9MICO|nr:hypothetical protein LEUCIP111803_01289 [Leucobacter soli]
MHHLVDDIAANLRHLRERGGFSLAGLSAASGIGKTTLSQLELGHGNPTIGTLEALAEVLGVDTAELLTPVRTAQRLLVVRRGEGVDEAGSGTGGNLVHTRRLGALMLEFHRIEYAPGTFTTSASHGVGASEHVLVSAGRITVSVDGESATLAPGDFATFPSDRTHTWSNLGDVPAEYWIAVSRTRQD